MSFQDFFTGVSVVGISFRAFFQMFQLLG